MFPSRCIDHIAQELQSAEPEAGGVLLGDGRRRLGADLVTGALAGIQQIPSRWVTYLRGSVTTAEGREHFTQADLQQLTLALLGVQVSDEGPADAPLGPTEEASGLYAANLSGAQSVPEDWAVVSLCRTGWMFAEHPVRR